MKIIEHQIKGVDGSNALLTGYVLDDNLDSEGDQTRPAVLILPGGGFLRVSNREAEPIAMKFAAAGFHAFVLRYSLVPSAHPTQLLEAAQAMQLIRNNSKEWHVNAQKVAIIGFSAGGHVAANLATSVSDDVEEANGYNANGVRPNALMLAYPVISAGEYAHKPTFDRLFGDVDSSTRAQLVEQLSLENHVDSKTPPVFVWQTITDQTVPVQNSIMFINACVKAGVSVEAHLFPKGPHGLALAVKETAKRDENGVVIPEFVQPEVQQWIDLACDWLNRTFA
ncbi:putative xylan esterase [Gardnerella vaginalis 55152]|uniref:Putative xylan esterase n=1 Tax=Gardnerella vaginalis 55152 TaxID=698955 RepID=I4LPN6_GARVA|nr:alpha/beta hydrolase [Gardnerella vaginalis]EIK78926.1 putative xylan esterase [Gardnerella vaginalis 55152]